MGIYRTYLPASIVEHILEVKSDGKDTIYSTPWVNGREKGFSFSKELDWKNPKVVFVSEHRNSDDLTITISKFHDWELLTNEEYEAREFFPYGSYNQVADRVLEILGVSK